MRKYKVIIFIAFVLIGAVRMAECSDGGYFQSKPYKEARFVMDTVVEMTAYGPNAEAAVQEAFNEVKHVQDLSDRFKADSQVSKINQMAGINKVTVDRDLLEMISHSKELSAKLDGSFDITIGALTDLWGIGQKGDYVPSQKEINKVLRLVGYRVMEVDVSNSTVYLPKPGMKLDLSGIAKDYAMNKATDILKAKGIKSALVNAGGDIRVIGRKPDGKPWRIGVQDPRKPDGMVAKLSLTEWDTLQVSGDYQRYFIKDNVRYAHILNPATGRQPGEVASVTLVYNGDRTPNIASSAFMVLGVKKGMERLKQFPGVEAIFVTTDGRVIVTPGLTGKVELAK